MDCAADHCDSEVGIGTGSNIDDQEEEAPADKAQDQLVEFRNDETTDTRCRDETRQSITLVTAATHARDFVFCVLCIATSRRQTAFKQARTVACCCSKEKKALLERGKCALAT